jgi:peptidoglycan-associated lipoprotein
MSRNPSRTIVTLIGLGVAATLLGGCPKTPVVSSGAGAGTGAAPAPRPATPAAAASPYATSPALKDVHFEVDRAVIRPGDAPILDANAHWLKANPAVLVLIEGHADERGSDAHNLTLAERRAKATREALVARGVPPSRIAVKAYGEQRPACTERTDPCWAKNRRAHFLVKL